ncbi:MAG: CO dehydrogenase/acetyl-CoA synthase subunit delta [Candidatus Freyarchaeota archaeon]|nr:CO dehydrogenase/acetyl-CoA synthase subunit delta [Candidatus Freyrarchaeum guaymaensis]HDO80745.1 CO dehydrogenase/acetyl-CoA synthase subunit delta [Candidatus Bathyarchaeota archaeon]
MVSDEISLGKRILEILEKHGELELENVTFEAEELVLKTIPAMFAAALPPAARARLPSALVEERFEPPVETYPGEIVEVQFGATRAEGGSRKKVVKVGGEKAPAFYRFEFNNPNRPVVTFDVFDIPIKLPKPITEHFQDVMEDPAAWAKKAINEFGADMVTVHLISTDPYIKDTPAKEAAKVVEDVLQAVDTPILIGGSGNPDKDPEVLEAAAEVSEGERLMLNSASLNLDWKRVADAAKKYGHNVLSWTQLDVNNQKKLNKLILDEGMPRNRIVQDATTASLGYGLEYSFSIYERIRLSALRGDPDLQMPLSSGTTNAWGAREAFMSDKKRGAEWGPQRLRGPIWEAITAVSLALVGCDVFMMLHPASVQIFKTFVEYLSSPKRAEVPPLLNWVTARV